MAIAANSISHNQKEVACVRSLAREYAAIANSAEQATSQQRWRDTYMLRNTDRAPIWLRLDPSCWHEILPLDTLECQEPWLRRIEYQLRTALYQYKFGDDAIMLPYWPVDAAIAFEGEHLWGVQLKRIHPKETAGAWAYDSPVKSPDDMRKLRKPTWRHDAAETDRRLNQFSELFADILPVRLNALPPIFPGIARNATELIGVDNLFLFMALHPEFMHELMAFIRDSVLQCMDQVEAMGIMTENNDQPIHFSESLKTTPANVPVRTQDMWLRTESQQFQGVSPAMWREFCLEYQKPIMQRFRYVSYGCCENLTDRIDDVLAIPNLRIFVKGPWTDLKTAAEKCEDKFSIVWRQMASEVIFAPDLAPIKNRFEEGMALLKGCHKSIILQEVATANGNPQRLHDWVAMAVEVSERLS